MLDEILNWFAPAIRICLKISLILSEFKQIN